MPNLPTNTASEAIQKLLDRIAEARASYDRFGATCQFESNDMIYASVLTEIADLAAEVPTAAAPGEEVCELERLRALVNSPELHDFARGVILEAGHQRERWGSEHDAGKTAADWFWLVGYLAGKALHAHAAGDHDKELHHTISAAAALANWHGAILGTHNMRPGIENPDKTEVSA